MPDDTADNATTSSHDDCNLVGPHYHDYHDTDRDHQHLRNNGPRLHVHNNQGLHYHDGLRDVYHIHCFVTHQPKPPEPIAYGPHLADHRVDAHNDYRSDHQHGVGNGGVPHKHVVLDNGFSSITFSEYAWVAPEYGG